jgi:hypothetical protein
MPGHDDFEIAIEQRRYGALDPAGAARLEEHLASCPDCRAFATLTSETEDEMRQQAALTISRVDWTRIEHGIGNWRDEIRRRPWRSLIETIVMLPALWLVFGFNMIGPTVGAVIGLEIVRRRLRGRLAESQRAEASRGALLDFYRRQLDREIMEHRRAVAIAAVTIVGFPLVILWRPHSTFQLAVAAGLTFAMVCLGAWLALIKLPRLRRERATLD